MTFKEFKDKFSFLLSVISLLLFLGTLAGWYVDAKITRGNAKHILEDNTEAINKNTTAISELSKAFVEYKELQAGVNGKIIQYIEDH